MPTRKQKPRRALVTSFPAPTGGLVSNRNLAIARTPDAPPGAAVLENMFPTATGVVLRRGMQRWASIQEDVPVKSVFSYISGLTKQLFAGNANGIRDITTVPDPNTFSGPDVLTGQTSGDWVTVQFSTAGGNFLVGVNGEDPAFVYDGSTFGATAITFPGGYTQTTADLSFVWVYKQRIWFIEQDSLNAWYLPVDQIGGELTLFPMGGIFTRGGSLLWGQAWSLASGGSGGLSEQCVFTTTEGEVAAYQGLSPDPDQGWTKVSEYRIGIPMGKKAFIRAGGDIVIATTVGFISLATASRLDYAALGQGAVSYPIEDDWAQAVQERGQDDWRCQVWAEGQMVLVAPPTPAGSAPVLFVANSNTGKWATFTNWDVTAFEAFQGRLIFGSRNGAVRQGWVTGSDEGVQYVGKVLPLFDDLGAPASLKVMKVARAIIRSAVPVTERLSGQVNYRINFPSAPAVSVTPTGSVWDAGIWGTDIWDAVPGTIVSGDWVSIGGSGHDVAVGVQITSGNVVPLDAEIIRIDLTYSVAEAVT